MPKEEEDKRFEVLDAHAYGMFGFQASIWMKTKVQKRSMICHNHQWRNSIRGHSKKTGKWQMQIARSICNKCTSLHHLCDMWY